MSFSQIAFAVGFSDPKYFYEMLQKRDRMTPVGVPQQEPVVRQRRIVPYCITQGRQRVSMFSDGPVLTQYGGLQSERLAHVVDTVELLPGKEFNLAGQ